MADKTVGDIICDGLDIWEIGCDDGAKIEREECANLVDAYAIAVKVVGGYGEDVQIVLAEVAAAIRARNDKPEGA